MTTSQSKQKNEEKEDRIKHDLSTYMYTHHTRVSKVHVWVFNTVYMYIYGCLTCTCMNAYMLHRFVEISYY